MCPYISVSIKVQDPSRPRSWFLQVCNLFLSSVLGSTELWAIAEGGIHKRTTQIAAKMIVGALKMKQFAFMLSILTK
jgi:hypothetical protein